MDIFITYIIFITFSAISLYILASYKKYDKGYWVTYGLLYGPLSIPFIYLPINNIKYNPFPTEFKEQVKYNDYKSASISAVLIAQLSIYLILPIMFKSSELEARGGGNVHPFEWMFWGATLGIPYLISYALAIISLIISLHALIKYKKINILICHSLLVFIFIQFYDIT